jgi:hypothetical protein
MSGGAQGVQPVSLPESTSPRRIRWILLRISGIPPRSKR